MSFLKKKSLIKLVKALNIWLIIKFSYMKRVKNSMTLNWYFSHCERFFNERAFNYYKKGTKVRVKIKYKKS